MTASFREYSHQPGFTQDFHAVREFLLRINQPMVTTPNFLWGRWEWAFSLPYLDTKSLNRIGIWEEHGQIVGLITYEDSLGTAYLMTDPEYGFLKPEMLAYGINHLSCDGEFKIPINDNDRALQHAAISFGLHPTQGKQATAAIELNPDLQIPVPVGYQRFSLADHCDIREYHQCLYRGFNHLGEPPDSESELKARTISISGPHVKRDLNIVVADEKGHYVSYCGMWYEPGTNYALVEPVCTVPEHRKKGCGKAAVLEAVRRCGLLGAKIAFVGSGQQFYFQIGFFPHTTDTVWSI